MDPLKPLNIQSDSKFNIFSEMFPNCNAFALIKCYAIVQMIKVICEESGWEYPHAALKNEKNRNRIDQKLNCGWDVSFFDRPDYSMVFKKIYKELESLSLKDFMRKFLPDFITQPEYAFELLDKVQYIEYACLALILLKIEWLNNFNGYEISEDHNYSKAGTVRKIFTADEWTSLSYAINCYAFKYTTKKTKPAYDAVKIFKEYHCPKDYQIALYGQVRENLIKEWTGRRRSWQAHITNGAHYIRKVNNQNPSIDALGMDDAINEAAERIGNIEWPTDFLEAVLVDASNNDSKIENDFVFSKFVGRLSSEDCIAVINPSPDFLCQYPDEFMESTTFVVPYEPMAWVLEHQFLNAKFVTFDEFAGLDDQASISNIPAQDCYSKILLFSRELSQSQIEQLVCGAHKRIKKNGGSFSSVMPSEGITGSGASRLLSSVFSLKKIDLLPQGTFNSTPKKKVFIEASGNDYERFVEITDYEFFLGKDEKRYLKKVSEEPITIESSLLNTPKSIYTVYREQASRRNVEEEVRKHPHYFSFSPEVVFWYTVTESSNSALGPKTEAYTCYFPTEKQKKRRLFPRGNKVKKAYASVSRVVDINEWCENVLPYKERIHTGVLEAFKRPEGKKLLDNGDVCLKTLWYLQLKLEGLKSNPKIEAEKELFSSGVGLLPLNFEKEDIALEMESFCENKSIEETALYWIILQKIIGYAVKNGYYLTSNPVDEFVAAFREKRDVAMEEVRSALMKKSFRLEEERRLLTHLFNVIPENAAYLSVLIRFFTGLEPNIVSALTWEDLHKVENTNVYQFWIYRQYKNNGEEPVPLEAGEDYRRIPIAPTLYDKLQERLNDIKQKTGLVLKDLTTVQIIATDAQLENGEREKKVTPRKINDLSKKAIRAIGIQEILVDLPDQENGTKETNLASYRGDIFRANFRYHAIFRCGFTDSEVRYILGLQQTSPFGKNYCDYLNSFAQFSLYQKLCRWDVILNPDETMTKIMQVSLPDKMTFSANSNRISSNFLVSLKDLGPISVRSDSKHGIYTQATLSEEGGQ